MRKILLALLGWAALRLYLGPSPVSSLRALLLPPVQRWNWVETLIILCLFTAGAGLLWLKPDHFRKILVGVVTVAICGCVFALARLPAPAGASGFPLSHHWLQQAMLVAEAATFRALLPIPSIDLSASAVAASRSSATCTPGTTT